MRHSNTALKLLFSLILSTLCFSALATKCDVDQDNDIDRLDISQIFKDRGKSAVNIDDPRDADSNMLINITDGRLCQRSCTLPRCAEPEPEPEISEYKIVVAISNANPTKLEASSSVKLNFSGPELVNEDIETVNPLTLTGPIKLATLQLRATPEEGQDIKIVANADGYIDTGASILLSPNQQHYYVELMLVKDEDGEAAPGILVTSQSIQNNIKDGKVVSPIELTSEVAFGSPAIRVSIPAGTEMTGSTGNLIDATKLKVVTYDPYEAQALDAYPGGLNVIADATSFSINGEVQDGEREINFKSAGFAAINIEDDAGNKVKRFSQDIEVAMQVKWGTQDAEGNTIKVGDTIPIWSYDEDTGKWSYEKEGTVQDLYFLDGMFDLIFPINHLSYFNLDWHFGAKCPSAQFVLSDLDGKLLDADEISKLSFLLTIDSPPAINRWFFPGSINNNNFHFINAPAGFSGRLNVFDQTRTTIMGVAEFTNICQTEQAQYDINVGQDDDLSFEHAMELANLLLSRPLDFKQHGISEAESDISTIITTAARLLAIGDERGQELFDIATEIIHQYAEAFLDNVDPIYEQRLLDHLPFIDPSAAFGGSEGYGCIHPEVLNLIGEIVKNHVAYEQFGGTGIYSISDSILQFLDRAGREYLSFSPDGLAYTALGVSEFVRCGFDISAKLQFFGYDGGTLDQEILDHFESVVLLNVDKMRKDIDLELSTNINLGSDLFKPVGVITYSTAATFDFILQDALQVATDLMAISKFSTEGLAEINVQIAFLQSLRDNGKVLGAPAG
ncbi:hypothetical protein HII17_04875 [Thalassotalea sp. M1531]|uniref:Uncharacterized protein n=1 Tax=Thalassotalea algicola TaxID=2716224 RepID=A0A7Y0Q7B6_9GAMM|nr:hypothetical protein [Thalassotalea algicola]NMP30890.1 hypothetical protein [Thalassotalea algicola]